jgi:mRNA-degrading endonuclease RelE of RelBE toxin-antitoxin system
VQVSLHRIADKYLNRLSTTDRERFDEAFADLEKESFGGDIMPIIGQPGRFRLQVGGYRALFKIEDDKILVTHIEPRGQAYTKKTRNKRG